MDKSLPLFCATRMETVNNGNAILIKRGEVGFWPGSVFAADQWADQDAFVEWFNERHHADKAAVTAMEIGSLMGWHVPGAYRAMHERPSPATTVEEAKREIVTLLLGHEHIETTGRYARA